MKDSDIAYHHRSTNFKKLTKKYTGLQLEGSTILKLWESMVNETCDKKGQVLIHPAMTRVQM